MLSVDSYITRTQEDLTIVEIYRSNTLAAIGRFYTRDGPVFVTFAFREAVHVPFGFGVLSKYKINAVYVLCCGSHWYQYEDSPALGQAVYNATRQFDHVALYGSSMGAYAALMFSGLMQADTVLAMSPQASINQKKVPFEKRWLADVTVINAYKGFIFDSLEKNLTRTGRVIIAYDPHDDDGKHVDLVKAVRAIDTVIFPFAHHRALMCFSEMGLASKILLSISDGSLDLNRLRRDVRANRQKSPTYCRSIGRYLLLHGKPGAREMLETAAQRTRFNDLEGLESNFRLIQRVAGDEAAVPHLLSLLKSGLFVSREHAVRDVARLSAAIQKAGLTAQFADVLENPDLTLRVESADTVCENSALAMAWLEAASGNNAQALEKLTKDESSFFYFLESARIFRHLGLEQEAGSQARRAYNKDSFSLDAIYFLADHMQKNGAYLEAAALYQKQDTVSPLPAKPYRYRLAHLLFSAGAFNEALEQCTKVLDVDAHDTLTHRLRGEVLTALQRYVDAYEVFQEAVARAPGDVGLLQLYALAAAHTGNFLEARAVAKRVIKLDSRRQMLSKQIDFIEKNQE